MIIFEYIDNIWIINPNKDYHLNAIFIWGLSWEEKVIWLTLTAWLRRGIQGIYLCIYIQVLNWYTYYKGEKTPPVSGAWKEDRYCKTPWAAKGNGASYAPASSWWLHAIVLKLNDHVISPFLSSFTFLSGTQGTLVYVLL